MKGMGAAFARFGILHCSPGVEVGRNVLHLTKMEKQLSVEDKTRAMGPLLPCLATLLDRDERGAEDSLGNNLHVQEVIFLSVREITEIQPLYALV